MVYVDNVKLPFKGKLWCHMIADSTDELDEMADKIGLKKSWIQNPGTIFEHYDITLSKKELAIKNGAKKISFLETSKILNNKRENNDNSL